MLSLQHAFNKGLHDYGLIPLLQESSHKWFVPKKLQLLMKKKSIHIPCSDMEGPTGFYLAFSEKKGRGGGGFT